MPMAMEKSLIYGGKQWSFQVDASIVQNMRDTRDNFLVQYDEQCPTKDYCAIYFSSNDIYYPNTEDIFRKRIVEQDVYEWYGTRIKKAYKHIFFRDIYKQWYLKGINNNIDTPEKLTSWLKDETKGYKVITIGSSAGGYAAMLYGSLLMAERILAFNPQFELNSLFGRSDEAKNPILYRLKDTAWNNYFDLMKWVSNRPYNIYYFYSSKSPLDTKQHRHIKDIKGIHQIGFSTSHHGIPFLKVALPKVLNMTSQELHRLESQTNSPITFTIQVVGLKRTLTGFYKQFVAAKLRRK